MHVTIIATKGKGREVRGKERKIKLLIVPMHGIVPYTLVPRERIRLTAPGDMGRDDAERMCVERERERVTG